ncbi:hypothetical protein RJ641_035090 [Dillenia turbinata]|uniref:Membrane protein of ER body-like protein n=1 Tax=Dillenia turbinata TaxID=194707 RepID=A0AAN8ZHW6_9MAGN
MEVERQWVYHEEEEEEDKEGEEEEEVGTDLVGRKSRNQNKTNPSIADDSNEYSVLLSESGNGFEVESINKEDIQEVVEEKNGEEEETMEEMLSNDGGIIVDVERDNGERKSVETSTCLDKQTGDKSSSVFSGVEFDSLEYSIPETNARCDASEITVNILEAQNGTGVATIHQDNKYLDDKKFHDFIFPSSEVSSGMQIHPQVEHENGLKKENEREITEFDVEKVLEKQNTHDLYCPNCNSCITRRVILRKRKRRIQDIHFGLKRERPEPIIHPEAEHIPADVTTDQDINVADESLDGNSATATNENNQVREREAFRCLSCFSIFIPTGSGFKLFQCFGDKNEDKNISSERKPARIFDHFFSIFQSDDGKMATQGNALSTFSLARRGIIKKHAVNEQQQETNVRASDSSYTLNNALTPQSAQPMTIQEPAVPVQPSGILGVVISGTMPSKEGKEDTVASSTEGPPQLGEVETDLGNKPANAEQNDKSVKIVQPPQDTTFNFQLDVLKAPVPSTKLTNEKPQNRVHVEPDLVMENATAGSHMHSLQPTKLPEPQKPAKEVQVMEDSVSASDQNISVTDQKVPVGLSVTEIITSEDEKGNKGKDVVLIIEPGKVTMEASQRAEDSVIPETINVPAAETQIQMGEHTEAREIRGFDILKSIVYGGLLESITSVGIVLSSAGADASTLNIMALGLANLITGLLLIGHNLKELKNDQTRTTSSEQDEQVDKYQETLGRRENFVLHAVVVVLSFIIFGLVPLVTYGLLFRKSDSYKDYKLLAVFGAAFVCIIALAVGKAHTQKPPRTPKTYIKTVMYYAALVVSASGISYIVGELIQELLNKLGWFASSASMNIPYLGSEAMKQPLWSSY